MSFMNVNKQFCLPRKKRAGCSTATRGSRGAPCATAPSTTCSARDTQSAALSRKGSKSSRMGQSDPKNMENWRKLDGFYGWCETE